MDALASSNAAVPVVARQQRSQQRAPASVSARTAAFAGKACSLSLARQGRSCARAALRVTAVDAPPEREGSDPSKMSVAQARSLFPTTRPRACAEVSLQNR